MMKNLSKTNKTTGSEAYDTDDKPTNSDGHVTSLEELVVTTFSALENNINDIIAFEEEAEETQQRFDRDRKMTATPSERMLMDSPFLPSKATKEPPLSPIVSEKMNEDGDDGDEIAKHSNQRFNSVPSLVPSKASEMDIDMDINTDASGHSARSPRSKGIDKSFRSGGAPKSPSERALAELYEITKKFDTDMEIETLKSELESITKDYQVFRNTPFGIGQKTARRRATLRRQGSGSSLGSFKRLEFKEELPPDFTDLKDARGAIIERLFFFQSSVQQYHDGDLPREIVAPASNTYDLDENKFGERLMKILQAIKAWIERKVKEFVTSFTPKERMIVKQKI